MKSISSELPSLAFLLYRPRLRLLPSSVMTKAIVGASKKSMPTLLMCVSMSMKTTGSGRETNIAGVIPVPAAAIGAAVFGSGSSVCE